MRCTFCEDEVLPGDRQVPLNDGLIIVHYECFLRQTIGSVGHLLRRCSCHGGTLEDPPGMSPREAASAAAYLYTLLGKWGVAE